LFSEGLRIYLAAGSLEFIHDRLQPRQLRYQVRERVFSASTQVDELYAGSKAVPNRPHLTYGSERSRVDAHDHFGSHAEINGQSGIDAAPAEAQIEYLPRNEDAVRWEATNLRLTTAFESRAMAAIVGSAINGSAINGSAINVSAIDLRVGALRHVYKIVCRARFL